jgi:Rho-binding antiterminator
MADYMPVDCAIYDHYELAIMRRRRLRLSWRDGAGVVHLGLVQPLDLETRAGEEFLMFVDMAGTTQRVRLDQILSVAEPPGLPAGECSDHR